MSTIQLNTTIDQETYDKAGKGFDPVPAGSYEAFVHEIEVVEVKQGKYEGKPRLKIIFKIKDGQSAADGTDVSGRQLWHSLNAFEVWSEKNQKNYPPFELIDLGKALGKTPEEIQNIDTDDWQGEDLQVTVKVVPKRVKNDATGEYEDSEDEKTNEISRFRSLKSADTSVKAKGKSKAGGIKLL